MREQPTGEDLLDAARALLRDELIPALPAERRHAALMIANAMAIAGREIRQGDAAQRAELAGLERLLGAAADAADPQARLMAANRELCAQLRAGLADEPVRRTEVYAHLVAVARARLEVSNPRASTR